MNNNMQKCYFSTSIDEELSCSTDGRFDEFGFPINICNDYPCKKWMLSMK